MEETLQRLIREMDRRRYGKYRGTVVDNRDDKHLGRLKVAVPSLFGEDEATWALPCLPLGGPDRQGMFFIPEIGSLVWVEFEQGDPDRPIWTGTFWGSSDDVPKEGVKEDDHDPTTRVLQTASGHRLQFDDRDSKRRIVLSHANASQLTLEEDGSVELTNKEGMKLMLSEARKELLLEDGKGNMLRMTEFGWESEDKNGNRIEMNAGGTTVSATTVQVNASSVSLGGSAGEPVLKGMSFLTKYLTHTHTVAPIVGGPTSPPIPQGEMGDLSTVVTTS